MSIALRYVPAKSQVMGFVSEEDFKSGKCFTGTDSIDTSDTGEYIVELFPLNHECDAITSTGSKYS